MKHLKKFESFKSKDKYEILTVDGIPFKTINYLIDKGRFDFSSDMFEVKMSDGDDTKTTVIPYDLFIEYITNWDSKLGDYLSSQEKTDIEDVLTELESFGWDFQSAIQGYVEEFVKHEDFKSMDDLEWNEDDEESLRNLTDEEDDF